MRLRRVARVVRAATAAAAVFSSSFSAAASSSADASSSFSDDPSSSPPSPTSSSSSSSSSPPPLPRIYSAPFTSPPLDGLDLLSEMERCCDHDISCAGISLEPNGTISGGSRVHRHAYVGEYATERTLDCGARGGGFTLHRGRATSGSAVSGSGSGAPPPLEVRDDLTVAEAKERCSSLPGCVALTYPVRSPEGLSRPSSVALLSEVRDVASDVDGGDEWRTYVINDPERLAPPPSGGGVDGGVPRPRVNASALPYEEDLSEPGPYRTCCDREDVPSISEVAAADTLERASCDMSREEFFLRYESRRRPVMLVGCGNDWPAVREGRWLPRNLAPRFGNATRWRARIGGETRLRSEDYSHNVRWGDVVDAMMTGRPYYIFDQLRDPEAASIDDDYEDPLPIRGGDLYAKLPHFNGPLRWFCVGPHGTGTKSHMDPFGTDAWNTLLRGHKWWIIYPDGFASEDALRCDPSCSVDSPLVTHWYASVGITAARSEYVPGGYGRHVLQRPGETIYVPDGLVHSVFNMDETVAITKNYASAANLDAVWMETVTSGDPIKWRRMYHHTLNRAQRRRVRGGEFWPPTRWERMERPRRCEADEEDEMAEYPMLDREEGWRPEAGEVVEALYEEEADEDETEYWFIGVVADVSTDSQRFSLRHLDDDTIRNLTLADLRRLPRRGDVVEAQYNGSYNEWYMATVLDGPRVGTGGGGGDDGGGKDDDGDGAAAATPKVTWDVRYADGEVDRGLRRESVRGYRPYGEGEMVKARWTDGGGGEGGEGDGDDERWVDSTVLRRNGDGTYGVRHLDGEEDDVPGGLIMRRVWKYERGADVIAMSEDDEEDEEDDATWERGVISKVRGDGRYDVRFDTGDEVRCLGWRKIRYLWAREGYLDKDDDEDEEEEEEEEDEKEEEEEEEGDEEEEEEEEEEEAQEELNEQGM